MPSFIAMETIADHSAGLKQAAQTGNVSARELSRMLNKRYPTIIDFLNGKLPNPQLDTIEFICAALGFSLTFSLQPIHREKAAGPKGKPVKSQKKSKSPGK
jgi:hypothetical protein